MTQYVWTHDTPASGTLMPAETTEAQAVREAYRVALETGRSVNLHQIPDGAVGVSPAGHRIDPVELNNALLERAREENRRLSIALHEIAAYAAERSGTAGMVEIENTARQAIEKQQ